MMGAIFSLMLQVGDFDADLLGSVAVANGDGVVGQSVEVDNDAFRGADFVLFAIAFADVAGVVPGDVAVFGL